MFLPYLMVYLGSVTEDVVERLNSIPFVFETHMSNAFFPLTHRFSQRKIVSSVCVLCLTAFISLRNTSDTQVALRKMPVADVQGYRLQWYRAAGKPRGLQVFHIPG